jgi:hypothetical protein
LFSSLIGVSLDRHTLYYRSPIHDELCIGILEYVLLVVHEDENKHLVILEKYGIGWTTINLFTRDNHNLIDVNETNVNLMKDEQTLQEQMMELNAPRTDK